MSVAGVRTSRPNMASLGVTPVTECTVILHADMSVGKYFGQLWTCCDEVVISV